VQIASTGIATMQQAISRARFQPGMGTAGVIGDPRFKILSPNGGMLWRKSNSLGLQFIGDGLTRAARITW
jgi:hypothetical protein